MKKASFSVLMTVAAGTLLLGSCGSVVRAGFDNSPVNALNLGGAILTGDLNASGAASLGQQGLQAQALSAGTLSTQGSFGDLDPAGTWPQQLGEPSGLDVPISAEQATFSNCSGGVTPSSDSITVTIKGVSLTMSDSGTPAGITESQSGLNASLPMQRTSAGVYGTTNTTTLVMLNLNWAKFKPVVNRGTTETPNQYSVSLQVNVESGAGNPAYTCRMSLKLSSSLQQYIQFD